MIIKDVQLKYCGPHEDLHVKTPAAVAAILGENGRGKTWFLRMLRYAFDGYLDGCTQQEAVTRGALDKKGEPVNNGSIKLLFEHAGLDIEVFRQFGLSPRQYLITGEGKKLTKVKDIQAYIQEIFDCDMRAIAVALFPGQGQLCDILFKTQAERENEAARLCLVDHLPKNCDIIEQETSILRRQITEHGGKLDEVEDQLREADAIAHVASQRVNDAPDRSETLKWAEALEKAQRGLTDRQEELQSALGGVTKAESRLKELKAPEGMEDANLDELRVQLESKREARQRLKDFQAEAEVVLASQERLLEAKEKTVDPVPMSLKLNELNMESGRLGMVKEKHEVVESKQEARDRAAKYLATEQEALEGFRKNVEALQGKVSELQAKYGLTVNQEEVETKRRRQGTLDEVLKVIGDVDGTCPLCQEGTVKCDALKDELAEIRKYLETANSLEQGIAKAMVDLEASTAKLKEQERLVLSEQEKVNTAEQELSAAQKEAEDAGPYDPDRAKAIANESAEILSQLKANAGYQETIDREEKLLKERAPMGVEKFCQEGEAIAKACPSQEEVDKLATQVSELSAWQRNSEGLREDVSNAKAVLSTARENVASAEQKLQQLKNVQPRVVTDMGLPLPQAVEKLKAEQAERSRLQGELDQATKAMRRLEERRDEIKKLQEKQASLRAVISDMERLKALFNRNGIQHQYLQEIFKPLAQLTVNNLSQWDSDFAVRPDPDHVFNFLFCRLDQPDEWMDQKQLSGGQRVRLSISFLLAVQQVVFPDIGFMALDEPSTHLDQQGVDDLGELLQTMSERLQHQGSQVFVIDHHEGLKRYIPNTVNLN